MQHDLPTAKDLAQEFLLFSLVKLRSEIEQAIFQRAESLGLPSEPPMGIAQLIQRVQAVDKIALDAGKFLRVIETMNLAAHSRKVEPADAAEALRVGSEFLARFRSEES